MRTLRWLAVLAALVGVSITAPQSADACGGCFGPVDTQQVVTDHRMVMAIHQNEATLWDQIRYTGRPEDFSWVLPVSGDVRIELAAGDFFDWLDANTAVRVQGPIPPQCPNSFGRGAFGAPTASMSADAGVDSDPVQVLHEAVIGPYQTVTLRSSDTSALVNWLRGNNYAIPPAIMPTIQWYVDRHMDFVALRLRPGEGVTAMQPVRIRYSGMNVVLPLRMVAAGVGDKVGILLWVFGSGRWEAANFDNREIPAAEVAWNWGTNRSNYADVFDSVIRRNGGRVWVTEFANLATSVGFRSFRGGPLPASLTDAGREDYNIATNNQANNVWVTRMRTDLQARFLDNDLLLQARATDDAVSNQITATRTIGTPPQPLCAPTRTGGVFGGGGAGVACAARPGRGTGAGVLLAALAAVAVAFGVRSRARR